MGIWLNLLIVAIVLIVLVFIYVITRKSPKKYFKKAQKLHKMGELYYQDDDSDLASDYYEEAEYYRKKGRELENVV